MNTHYKYTIRMAALALVGAAITACSSIDDEQAELSAGKTVVLTGTLSDKAGDNLTRAFSVDEYGTSPQTSWAEGEEVAVYYEKTDGKFVTAVATIKDADGNFEATLTDPKDGTVKFVYPVSRHDGQGSYTTTGIENQDGTVKNISDNWDIVTGEGTMTVADNKATITKTVGMEAQLSICRFRLMTQNATSVDGVPLSAQTLSISVNDGENTTTYTVTPTDPSEIFYVAMLPTELSSEDIDAEKLQVTFTATTADQEPYTKTAPATFNFEKGKFIVSNVKFAVAEEEPSTPSPNGIPANRNAFGQGVPYEW